MLEGETRVLSQRGLQTGIGMSSSGGSFGEQRMAGFIDVLAQKGIDTKDLAARIRNPIKFRPLGGGRPVYGFEATILADICDVILSARKMGALVPQQFHIADQCELLVRAFARVGIIALVDEATGCDDQHPHRPVGARRNLGLRRQEAKKVERHELSHKGDQYTFIALASSAKAIVSYRTGKRDSENTDLFVQDLRERVLGAPEISTDGFHPYKNAFRDAFNGRASHGVIVKAYCVVNLAVKDAARRYSPAEVISVERDVVSGLAQTTAAQ